MASTEFVTGDAQSRIAWSRSLVRETLGKMFCKRFIGKEMNSPIRFLRDLVKDPGDKINYDLRIQGREAGRFGDSELEGFEKALTFYGDSVLIDQYRQAHECRGMSQQRTVHNLRMEARESLSTWWAAVYDSLMFAYLSGYVGTVAANPECCLPHYGTGGFAGNTVTVPTGSYLYAPAGTMELEYLDVCVSRAKTLNPRIEPTMVDGKPYYIVVMHPYSVRELRTSAVTGPNWRTIQQEVGPRAMNNPIFTGALGIYNQCVLHESEFIPRDGSANPTKNVFLGASAGVFAAGNAWGAGASQPGMFKWTESLRDYENIKGVGSSSIFGIKGTIFNSLPHGRITLATQCAAV